MSIKKHPRRSTRVKRSHAEMRREGNRIAAKRYRIKRKRAHVRKKRHYGDQVPNLATAPFFPPSMTMGAESLSDSLGMLMLPMIARQLGFRGRDIFRLLDKILPESPAPTAEPQESGTASSTKPTRARSKTKKEKTA